MSDSKSCVKCGYSSENNSLKFQNFLCDICNCFAPDEKSDFDKYILEKVSQESLQSFRNFFKPKGLLQKQGMVQKASKGEIMSRAPFGYKIVDKKLVPAQNYDEVREIFEEFSNSKISLRELSAKHKLSVNGLKKVLRNFAYIGKIKFNGQIHSSSHTPIISSTLFNHVQNKLERLGIKKN